MTLLVTRLQILSGVALSFQSRESTLDKKVIFYKGLCILLYYDKIIYNNYFVVGLREDFMFKNISDKIKAVAEIICFIGILISLFSGFASILKEEILLGILVIILGSLSSWIGTLALYGLGELIENSQTIIELLEQETKNENIPNNIPMSEVLKPVQLSESDYNYDNNVKDDIIKKMIKGKISTLEKWRKEGIITDEEFNEKKKELLGL